MAWNSSKVGTVEECELKPRPDQVSSFSWNRILDRPYPRTVILRYVKNGGYERGANYIGI